jgi:hypothetical protein
VKPEVNAVRPVDGLARVGNHSKTSRAKGGRRREARRIEFFSICHDVLAPGPDLVSVETIRGREYGLDPEQQLLLSCSGTAVVLHLKALTERVKLEPLRGLSMGNLAKKELAIFGSQLKLALKPKHIWRSESG